jgi:hypothetical protein
MGPEVRVGVDNRAVGNLEDLGHGDGQKGKGPELGMLHKIVVGASAHQNGTTLQAGEALKGGGSVAFRVYPK